MKKRIFILCILALLLLLPLEVQAIHQEDDPYAGIEEEWKKEIEEGISGQLEGLDLKSLDDALDKLDEEGLGGYSARRMIEDVTSGNMPLSTNSLLELLGKLFLKEVGNSWHMILKVIVMALLCSLMTVFQSPNARQGVSDTAYFVCYVLIIMVLAQSLSACVAEGIRAIDSMAGIMEGVFPILIALLTALGGVASAGVFQPAMAALTGGIVSTIRGIIMPVVLGCGVLVIVSNVSERIQIKRLTELIKSVCQWLIGIVFTIYIGVVAIQGMSASAIDGISIRTAKYTIDRALPIAGKMLADTVDTMMGCSLVLKNALGVVTLIVTIALIAAPVIHILVNIFLFRMAAALIEPVGDKRIADCLFELSDVLVLLLIIVLATGIMMFITIGLAMSAGNANIMLR
ncbi:MAG: stage III sporulation protein AE [Christensenellales bacterium]|jgi:stage III sporulation protein AE